MIQHCSENSWFSKIGQPAKNATCSMGIPAAIFCSLLEFPERTPKPDKRIEFQRSVSSSNESKKGTNIKPDIWE